MYLFCLYYLFAQSVEFFCKYTRIIDRIDVYSIYEDKINLHKHVIVNCNLITYKQQAEKCSLYLET
jgi:hypothetical protein